ncbi:Mce family protein [Gordonia effusa NBRC 100432]|uniref:Mce family protein n=1 Tax=Gordonia effusa NBRC 100432 TaxID=1077974 RepID=H0QV83_9ACTN|nr:MCE family protein [Gordonia effusa]GAB16734.1 Mce family protein [Gordonia effusa NBRC 100432]
MAISKKTWLVIVAVVVILALLFAGYFGYKAATKNKVTAYFASVTGLYNGDPVRVVGVNVGRVTSISPQPNAVKVTMELDKDVKVPADAKAVIVAQSLVSGRFIQLTPVYTEGATMVGGADIPMERTAVPMEWDDVKKQLTRLTDAVGPKGTDHGTLSDAVDVAYENLAGNGKAINSSIKELSDVMGTLSSGRGDLFATIRSLQKLTDSLSTSHEQMMQFNGRIASVSSVLANNTTALNGALHNLDSALSDIKSFIDTNGSTLSDSIRRLSTATTVLRTKDEQVQGLLHSGPTQLANFYNIYNPLFGSLSGIFGLGMGSNLVTLLCGTMQANDRPGQDQKDVEKCVDTIAPLFASFTMNYPPFLANPVTGVNARPNQIKYQNASVKARAQADIRQLDAQTRKDNGNTPLGNLLVPYGGEK